MRLGGRLQDQMDGALIATLKEKNAELSARIAELESALEPFAELLPVLKMSHMGEILHSWGIHKANEFELRAGDIRRAAQVLKKG